MQTLVHKKYRHARSTPPDSPRRVASDVHEPHRYVDIERERPAQPRRSLESLLSEDPIALPETDAVDETENLARARWLEEHDVDTKFVDAGIGCVWFAQQGDNEPVSGETEDEALEKLARETGLTLWDRSAEFVSPSPPVA